MTRGEGPFDHPVSGICSRDDLVDRVCELGHTHRRARRLVNAVFDLFGEALERSEPVALRGFGRFEVVERAGHPARNPTTGEPTSVPAHRAVVFRCAPAVRDALTEALPPPGEEP